MTLQRQTDLIEYKVITLGWKRNQQKQTTPSMSIRLIVSAHSPNLYPNTLGLNNPKLRNLLASIRDPSASPTVDRHHRTTLLFALLQITSLADGVNR